MLFVKKTIKVHRLSRHCFPPLIYNQYRRLHEPIRTEEGEFYSEENMRWKQKFPGRKKRRVGLLVGYVGTGYNGSQMNSIPDTKTIEGVLYEALFAGGFIKPSNYGELQRISWTRSSRTDKGVHSVSSLFSAKLEVEEENHLQEDDTLGTLLCDDINKHLPPEIRVLSAKRVPNSFDARRDIIWREYEYLIPNRILNNGSRSKLNELMNMYNGTHMFHNFTSSTAMKSYRRQQEWKKKFRNQELQEEEEEEEENEEQISTEQNSVQIDSQFPEPFHYDTEFVKKLPHSKDNIIYFRNVVKSECHDEITLNGESFTRIRILGSSFLYNQIRKMIGCAIAIANERLPHDFLELALHSNVKIRTPKAPGEPLILNSCGFKPRKTLTYFMDMENEKMIQQKEDFKKNYIYPEIIKLLQNNIIEEFMEEIEKCEIKDDIYEQVRKEGREFIEWKKNYKLKRREETRRKKLEEEGRLKNALPTGLRTQLMVRYRLVPGLDSAKLIQALEDRIKNGELQPLQSHEYYFEYVDKYGVQSLIEDPKNK